MLNIRDEDTKSTLNGVPRGIKYLILGPPSIVTFSIVSPISRLQAGLATLLQL